MKCYSIGINGLLDSVVPHEGTWIEMVMTGDNEFAKKSFPTRERGLKSAIGQ